MSTIPPFIHTHSFTYQPRYIIFLSQYFSFPLSVPFHHCSTHSFTYHKCYILFLSHFFRFPLSVPFHHCSTPIHSSTIHATCFSPSASVSLRQYHSTIPPLQFIQLPPSPHKISFPVFQFPSVSTITPLLHIHSPINQATCFSPSTSVVRNIPPLLHTFIHLPPTLDKVTLPKPQFPRQYHSTIAPHTFIPLHPTLHNVCLPVI